MFSDIVTFRKDIAFNILSPRSEARKPAAGRELRTTSDRRLRHGADNYFSLDVLRFAPLRMPGSHQGRSPSIFLFPKTT
ncbi:hypothetical protein CEXT_317611 [Caerostris extrusa]|uniref:Ycf15 n=1 Tax=Caerostris extrusa TaxID=172846 RepID=A0AAV4QVP3_CAEEX|nr:hypothetical protein CEXT_317611 [Caerostris extrusa]